ncbi:MAG: PepSY domain-containing protein [Ferruginibacter sp.]
MLEERTKSTVKKNQWRLIHRYLGFFLAGIMAVYAISGIILIFRDTTFLKKEVHSEKIVAANLTEEALGKELKQKNLKFTGDSNGIFNFKNGTYNAATGKVNITTDELPFFVTQLTKLHKANTGQPLFFLNIFFGVSLLFFVLSSFWMFRPKSSVFKKGMYWTVGGIALTLLLLFYK